MHKTNVKGKYFKYKGKKPYTEKKKTHTHKTHVAIVATSSCIITE